MSTSTLSKRWSPTQRSATADWAVSRPASWRAWRASTFPAYGYGIRYNHGLFRQKITDGWQIELPENWLEHGNPWEFPRREAAYEIGFGGQVVPGLETGNKQQRRWKPGEKLLASACDTPMVGWRGKRVNTLDCGRRAPWTRSASMPSTAATMARHWPRATRPRSSPACSIPPTRRRPDRNCGCGRSTSSPPLRCRTSSAATCSNMTKCARSPTRWRSSSTTRIPPLPSPNSCASSSTITRSTGTRPGRSPRTASATPTTRCCLKRWKAGPSICSSMCCRATCRSSTRSTPSSSPKRRSGPAAPLSSWPRSRSSTSTTDGACAWASWPSPARTRSTASRRSTRR